MQASPAAKGGASLTKAAAIRVKHVAGKELRSTSLRCPSGAKGNSGRRTGAGGAAVQSKPTCEPVRERVALLSKMPSMAAAQFEGCWVHR